MVKGRIRIRQVNNHRIRPDPHHWLKWFYCISVWTAEELKNNGFLLVQINTVNVKLRWNWRLSRLSVLYFTTGWKNFQNRTTTTNLEWKILVPSEILFQDELQIRNSGRNFEYGKVGRIEAFCGFSAYFHILKKKISNIFFLFYLWGLWLPNPFFKIQKITF